MSGRPGVGVLFNPALADFVCAADHGLDHLAAIPDRCWLDHGIGAKTRFEPLLTPTRMLQQAAHRLPLVLHGIGLLERSKRGVWVYYRVVPAAFDDLATLLGGVGR